MTGRYRAPTWLCRCGYGTRLSISSGRISSGRISRDPPSVQTTPRHSQRVSAAGRKGDQDRSATATKDRETTRPTFRRGATRKDCPPNAARQTTRCINRETTDAAARARYAADGTRSRGAYHPITSPASSGGAFSFWWTAPPRLGRLRLAAASSRGVLLWLYQLAPLRRGFFLAAQFCVSRVSPRCALPPSSRAKRAPAPPHLNAGIRHALGPGLW
jgi:hypothetical protein